MHTWCVDGGFSRGAPGARHARRRASFLPVHVFRGQQVTIKGKVTEFMFRNPHSVVQVLAPGDDGKMYRWAVEWAAAAALARDGKASRDILHPGDEVIVTGAPGRNPDDHKIRLYTIERPSDGWSWKGTYD